MKSQLLFLSLFLLSTITSNSQTVDVISGLGEPYDVLLNGNDLYVAEFTSNRVSKIDISSGTPTRVDVVTGISGADGVFLNGNDLYVSSYNSNFIIKVDITLPFPAPIDTVVSFINGPAGMVLRGNDLYIAEYNAAQIVKIDITNPLPITSIDTVASGTASGGFPNINSLEIDGDFLYFSEDFFGADQVSRVDLTQPIPITPQLVVPPANVNGPRGIITIGTDLYITEAGSGDISKIDLTGSIPTIPTLVSNTIITPVFSGPADIVFNGTNLYVAEQVSGKITQIRLLPDEPTLIAGMDTICEGSATTINVSATDTLNAGTNWFLYANDLIGLPIDSSATGSFTINPMSTTDYIVRGEGVGFIGEPDTLTITVNPLPNAVVTQSGNTLMTSVGNFTYQWIDCNTNTAIIGANDSIYTFTTSGAYRVAITNQAGCSDTSLCTIVTTAASPDQPTLITSMDTICEGENVLIMISANDSLNSGSNWFLYENSLSSLPIDSSLLGSFVITGVVTTNYIVRGEGNGVVGQPDTVAITVNTLPSASVTQSGDTLSATFGNYAYQWIDCNTNMAITGANDSVYVVTVNGDYGVVVTDLATGCSDTSTCVNVIVLGVLEEEKAIEFIVYPNPSNGQFTLEIVGNETLNLEVLNNVGQVVLSEREVAERENINIADVDSGLYLIRLTNKQGEVVYRKILIR